MVKSLSPSIARSSFNSIPDREKKSAYSARVMMDMFVYVEVLLSVYSTTVFHQVLVEVKQLFSNVFRTGTFLLVILKV